MSVQSNSPYDPDLRGFIAYLQAEHPEHIVRITKEVDPRFGVSGILERLENDGQFPLVIFENVTGSDIPLVANMHASFERLRLARPTIVARRHPAAHADVTAPDQAAAPGVDGRLRRVAHHEPVAAQRGEASSQRVARRGRRLCARVLQVR